MLFRSKGAENVGMNAMLFEMDKKDSMMAKVLEYIDGRESKGQI